MAVGDYPFGKSDVRQPLFDPSQRAAEDETWGPGGGAFPSTGVSGYAQPTFQPKDADFVNWSTSPTVMTQAMLGEFVKIGGFRYENREWSWSPENVGRYFAEEPVWAAIDALTLGAPVAQWGKAAYLVGRGQSAAGRAYKAGRLTRQAATKLQQANLAPTSRFGRFITNPAARERFTPEYQKLLKEYGASDWERQAGLDVLRREYVANVTATNNRVADLLAKIGKADLTPEQQKSFVRLMESGANPAAKAEIAAGINRLLGEQGRTAFDTAWEFRGKLGQDAIDLGMLSPDAALRQQTYWPQMRKQQFEEALKSEGYRFAQADVLGEASWDNFRFRKYSSQEFESKFVRDFDVANGIRRMGMAHQAVNREKFARAMMDSGIVQSADDLLNALPNIIGNPNARRLWGITDAKAQRLATIGERVSRHADGTMIEESLHRALREETGWSRLQDVAPGLNLPKGYRNLLVDPAAVKDLEAAFKLLQGKDGLLQRAYSTSNALFRVGKTAYNPATHVRNLFGAQVFHTLATGLGSMVDGRGWVRGWKAYRKGMDDPIFRKAAESGVLDATIDRELRDALGEVGLGHSKTAMDFLGDSKFAQVLQKVGGKAERFYRGIDDVSRLDAFAREYERFRRLNKHRVATGDVLRAGAKREAAQAAGLPPYASGGPLPGGPAGMPGGPGPAPQVGPRGPGMTMDEFQAGRQFGAPPQVPGQAGMQPPQLEPGRIPPQIGPGAPPPTQIGPVAGRGAAQAVPEQGPTRFWFHGRKRDTKPSFRFTTGSRFGPGFYTSDQPGIAGLFTGSPKRTGRMYEAVAKNNALYDMSQPLDQELLDLIQQLSFGSGKTSRVVKAARNENPQTLQDFFDALYGAAEDAGVAHEQIEKVVHKSLQKSLEKRGHNGLLFRGSQGAGSEQVFWNPKRDLELRQVTPGAEAVQRPAPRRLPAQAGGKTLKQLRDEGGPVGPGNDLVPTEAMPVQGPRGSTHYPPAARPESAVARGPGGRGPVGPPRDPKATSGGIGGEDGGWWTPDELDRRAVEYAALQVAKYIPSFALNSRLTNTVRQHIPFSSFSHEAIRVWKNTMVEKPHLAYFWSHFTDFAGEFFGAAAGFTPEEIKLAKEGLPYYQEGKKMMMWPFAVEGKPVFVDMSYLIPLANIVEIEREEQTYLGKAASLVGLNPTSNPLASVVLAGATGIDPFRGQPVEPRLMERQFGVPFESPQARLAVGLAEHAVSTFMPPVIPPGYVGLNLTEYVRGQSHPTTGANLEDGLWRTLSTNLLGIRLHEADANAAMLNVGHEERRLNGLTSDWWERWQWAVANDKVEETRRAEENIFELQLQRGKTPEEAMNYLRKGVENRVPGKYKNFPKRQIEEALRRMQSLRVGEDPQDKAQIEAMREVVNQ